MSTTNAAYYRSIADMNEVILRELYRIPRGVDLVVGIPRSGLLAANIIALYLNTPLTDLEGLKERRILSKGKRKIQNYGENLVDTAKKILIVDDCVSQGTEMRRARSFIEDLGLSNRCLFLTIFCFPEHPREADIVLEKIPRPMCFQWSFLHTPELKYFALDIDNLIFREATPEERISDESYINFLKNAKPLLLPTYPVGWLFSGRPEKYRALTEKWLKTHGVEYENLVMMESPEKDIRDVSGEEEAQFKADAYKQSDAILLIVDCPQLAESISELADKPTLCMKSDRLIPAPSLEAREITLLRWRYLIRRIGRFTKRVFNPRAWATS